ncbi:hypothetical protein OAO99_04725 [Candidatus Pelagibacter sp.]|jgi:hypothetical protein|nr:hypothetical protein [Candidatus Pelagibacter sp.]
MSIALIPNTSSWSNYLNLSKLLIKKKEKVIFIITNEHVKKLKKKLPKQVTVIDIIEPNKNLLLELNSFKIFYYFFYFLAYLKIYLKSLYYFQILNIEKIITVGDRENGTILSILKIAKKNKIKIFIYHAGGMASKNMLVLSRLKFEIFDVTLDKNFIHKFKNQCNKHTNKKTYAFYHPVLTKIFNFFDILPSNPWVMGSGNSDIVLVESNFVKNLYLKSNLKKELLVIGSCQIDNINESFKQKNFFKTRLNINSKKKNPINIGFTPNVWFEHNLLSKDEAYKRNDLLCKILKDSADKNKANVLVFLHPKQKIKNYQWIEQKYRFKIYKKNISYFISNLDYLFIGFSSTIIYWASDLGIKVLVANFFKEKNSVFKNFKNVRYFDSIPSIKKNLENLKKNKKKTNIYEDLNFKKNIISLIINK